MKKALMIFIFILIPSLCFSGTYYVAKNGNDTTGNGSEETPWLTIQKLGTNLVADDIGIVKAGTYDETISFANTGSAGHLITIKANTGDTVITRRFTMNQYCKVEGFEITHDSTHNQLWTRGFSTTGAVGAQIINNTIHHTISTAIWGSTTGAPADYLVIRGNTIYNPGCPAGVAGGCIGAGGILACGSYMLIENNNVSHVSDYFNIYGSYNIIRNNTLGASSDADCPDTAADQHHIDMWQTGGVAAFPVVRTLFENNVATDNIELNSHFMILQDTVGADNNVIVRGNVAARIGSLIGLYTATDYLRLYNNTFVDGGYHTKANYAVSYGNEGADYSENNFNLNNIYYQVSNSTTGTIIAASVGNSVTSTTNLCYSSGTHASCIAETNGVDFVNYAADNFHLQSTSDARGAGTVLTTVTSATGSGTSFVVGDAGFFVGGWGVLDTTGTEIGDTIKVGSASPVKITDINYGTNTITVASSISWNNGDGVHLSKYYNGTTVDIGAYEYSTETDGVGNATIGSGAAVTVGVGAGIYIQ